MTDLVRRIAAAALVLVLSAAGSLGLCAGWAATAEARMACCVRGAACPMHKAGDDHARQGVGQARSIVSQADADACCAASERDDATPSAIAFVPLVALLPAISPIAFTPSPIDLRPEAWYVVEPARSPHVPTHLLLSVFLI